MKGFCLPSRFSIIGVRPNSPPHTTILNQLGFDHEKFTYQFQGRPFRLTDVEGEVIREVIYNIG